MHVPLIPTDQTPVETSKAPTLLDSLNLLVSKIFHTITFHYFYERYPVEQELVHREVQVYIDNLSAKNAAKALPVLNSKNEEAVDLAYKIVVWRSISSDTNPLESIHIQALDRFKVLIKEKRDLFDSMTIHEKSAANILPLSVIEGKCPSEALRKFISWWDRDIKTTPDIPPVLRRAFDAVVKRSYHRHIVGKPTWIKAQKLDEEGFNFLKTLVDRYFTREGARQTGRSYSELLRIIQHEALFGDSMPKKVPEFFKPYLEIINLVRQHSDFNNNRMDILLNLGQAPQSGSESPARASLKRFPSTLFEVGTLHQHNRSFSELIEELANLYLQENDD